jgi:hypothetical protein
VLVGQPSGPLVTLDATPPSPATCGQDVQLSASVPATATGTIEFFDGATSLGAPVTVVGGNASFTWSAPAAGSHSLVAKYSGDGCYKPGQSAPQSYQVDPIATTTNVTGSPNPSKDATKVNLQATVSPSGAPGVVVFKDGGNTLGSANVVSGIATLSVVLNGTGPHAITGEYGGGGCYGASSGGYTQNVVPDNVPAVTVVSPNGGEILAVGSTAKLSWTASDDNGVVSGHAVDLSRQRRDVGRHRGRHCPTPGTYEWVVSPPGTNTNATPVFSALFRVRAKDTVAQVGEDQSDAPFALYDVIDAVTVTRLDATPTELGIALKWAFSMRDVFTSVAVERADAESGPLARGHRGPQLRGRRLGRARPLGCRRPDVLVPPRGYVGHGRARGVRPGLRGRRDPARVLAQRGVAESDARARCRWSSRCHAPRRCASACSISRAAR